MQFANYRHGKPDWDRTSFFVPNDHVFAVVARHSKSMIACPSINPDRADALERTGAMSREMARLFKIHPPTQGVDVADRKHGKFFRPAALELDMVILVQPGLSSTVPR